MAVSVHHDRMSEETEKDRKKREYKAAWYQANKERLRAEGRTYYETHREEIRASKKAWAENNPEKMAAYKRDWATKHPDKVRASQAKFRAEHKDTEAARTQAWAEKNRDKRQASNRKHYALHWAPYPEQTRERHKRWMKANPEKQRVIDRNRKARKRAVEGRHTAKDIQRLYVAQNGKCAYCRIDLSKGFQVDHIIALANGGTNWPKNLQLCCPSCNARKRAKDPIDFAREVGRLL